MEITELKEVIKREPVVVGIKCDVCGKDIKYQDNYFRIIMQHHDWGNDSCDSIEIFDVCSKDCILPKLSNYFKYCDNSDTYCFEIQQARCYINKEQEETK